MKRSRLSPRWVVLSLVVLPVGYRAATWLAPSAQPSQFREELAASGQELFSHEWGAGDPLAGNGDGLGPVFNATSCVACHRQAGAGGGGPLENNVTMYSVRAQDTGEQTKLGVVHKFAVEPAFQETLASVSIELPSSSEPELADLFPTGNPNCPTPPKISPPLGIDVSQRNTPALFGARLIDSVPDRLIIANERKQRLKWGLADSHTEQFPVGRALRLADGRVGKFGWKAQIASLSDFVRAACANELGLGNPSNAQPASLEQPEYQTVGLDLTDAQCDELTAFVASLPSPRESVPQNSAERAQAKLGKELFSAVGCADCHIPDMGDVEGIYSDLLLHRMGKELTGGGSYSDPPPVLPDLVSGDGPHSSEWRTPPLWGVADSAPYLHDGRAATLEAAILAHGGQGERSQQEFAKLAAPDRECVIAFLRSLRAPGEPEADLLVAK
jgi:CxxC motif-containing protein (DUF1111 family)